MKRRFVLTLLLVFLLVFQLSPLVYAGSLAAPEEGVEDTAIIDTTNSGVPETPVTATGQPELLPDTEVLDVQSTELDAEAAVSTLGAPLAAVPSQEVHTLDAEATVTLIITGLKIEAGFLATDEWAQESLTLASSDDALTTTFAYLDAQANLSYSTLYNNTMLDSITYENTVTLGSASSGNGYSFWEFFVNGVSSVVGAGATYPQEGDVWEWRYNDGAEAAFASQAFEVKVTGVESVGGVNAYVPWIPATKYYGSNVSALTAALAVLDKNGFTYGLDYGDTFLSSITKADGTTTLAGESVGGDWSFWTFLVNNAWTDDGASDYLPVAGDVVEFKYSMAGESAPVEVVVTPDAPRPDYSADNAGFTTNRTTESTTPVQLDRTVLSFKTQLKESTDWETGVSDILLVNNDIYVAVGQELYIYSGSTGEEVAKTQLANPIGYTCRPLYTQGLIIVPLEGGRLQAFTADTLTCVWVTEVLAPTEKGAHQSYSTLIEKDGYLYYGTAVADWVTSFSGSFLCVDIATGTVIWKTDNATTGYYWAGAVSVGEYVYIADDAGTITGFSAVGGWQADSIELGTPFRSALITDGSSLYAIDYAGKLWQVTLGDWGMFGTATSIQCSASSTSTPVISGGKLYVGGQAADYSGVLSVVDLASFSVERTVSLPAPIQSSPLVSVQGSDTYVYFTCNSMPGGVYCYKQGANQATEIFVPTGDDANYCMASVVAASDGVLYYTNDSGRLFALAVGDNTSVTPVTPEEPAIPSTPDNGTTGSVSYVTRGSVVVTSVDASSATGTAAAQTQTAQTQDTAKTEAASVAREIEGTDTPLDAAAGTGVLEQQSFATDIPVLPVVGIGVAGLGIAGALVWYGQAQRKLRLASQVKGD